MVMNQKQNLLSIIENKIKATKYGSVVSVRLKILVPVGFVKCVKLLNLNLMQSLKLKLKYNMKILNLIALLVGMERKNLVLNAAIPIVAFL